MARDEYGPWAPASPREVHGWLSKLSVPWWIAGGWALDAFVGRQTRAHDDIDVGCFRDHQDQVRAALAEWEFFAARPERLRVPLSVGEHPELDVHSLWCRPSGSATWRLQIMLDPCDGDDWLYRRDPRIRIPVRELTLQVDDGPPFLRPEIQLLYKAKGVRPKDELDWKNVLPLLGVEARRWLEESLARAHPGHPWLRELQA